MSEDGPLSLRASDDDRHRVAAALSDTFARGQLDHRKFDAGTEQIRPARYRDELFSPPSDLMPDRARILEDRAPAPRPQAAPRPPRAGGGDQLYSPTHHTRAMPGSTVIDLRIARLTAAEATINAFDVRGGAVELLVPEDAPSSAAGTGCSTPSRSPRTRRSPSPNAIRPPTPPWSGFVDWACRDP